jgi:hypothetical protein
MAAKRSLRRRRDRPDEERLTTPDDGGSPGRIRTSDIVVNNFARVHRTLRCTAAIAAGVTDRLWSVEELVEGA